MTNEIIDGCPFQSLRSALNCGYSATAFNGGDVSTTSVIDDNITDLGGVAAHPPVNILYRDVSVDIYGMFSALTETSLAAADSFLSPANWLSAATKFRGSVKLKEDLNGLAWRLITRSLVSALFELASEIPLDSEGDFHPKHVRKDAGLTGSFDGLKGFEITEAFFRAPKNLPLLKPTEALFQDWLEEGGMNVAKAQNVARRLPPYFVLAIHKEWAAFSNDYEKLLKALNSPFQQAAKLERRWATYRAYLQRVPAERLFGVESYGLEDIYISLRAWRRKTEDYDEGTSPSRAIMESRGVVKQSSETRIVVDAQADLLAWIEAGDKDDAIRIVSGGPGHGKSTLTRMLAAKVAAKAELPILRIPLHRLDGNKTLEEGINAFAKDDHDLKGFELSELETPLLLIFDGLDELEMQGDVGARVAKKFADSVIKLVDRKNGQGCRLMALLTGRTLVTDGLDDCQEKEGQVLHLIDYGVDVHKREDPREEINWEDNEKLLGKDQREQWWKQYFKLSGRAEKETPEVFTTGKLDDITRQPLLNYLVSLRPVEDGQSQAEININRVLDDLLKATFDRTWGAKKTKKEQVNPLLHGVEFKGFERFLEEVSVASWHKGGRAAPMADVLPRCQKGALKKVIDGLEEVSKSGALRLLTAFYFQRSSQLEKDTQTFEFTHKSFREYLTATAIVRMGETMVSESQRHNEDSDRGWSDRQCLKKWLEFIGPAHVNEDLLPYLLLEVANLTEDAKGREALSTWGETLDGLFRFSLERGPDLRDVGGLGFQEGLKRVNNAEVALFALMFAVAQSRGEGVGVFAGSNRLKGWLHQLGASLADDTSRSVATHCLEGADLKGSDLIGANLEGADLIGASLENVILTDAILLDAILWRANLSGADLFRSSLSHSILANANLTGANISNADMSDSFLVNANLVGADLIEANLSGSDFSGANLRNANLSGANLSRGKLHQAHLACADLSHTELRGADLSSANLHDSNLYEANLIAANLNSANLFLTNLHDANLRNATLIGADLRQANLISASLFNANLNGADLRGADLRWADFSEIKYDNKTQWPEGFTPPPMNSEKEG